MGSLGIRTPGGFTQISNLRTTSYFSYMKVLLVGSQGPILISSSSSSEERILSSSLISMKEDVSLVFLPKCGSVLLLVYYLVERSLRNLKMQSKVLMFIL